MLKQTDSFLVMDRQGIKHTILELTQYHEYLSRKDYLESKEGELVEGLKYFETAEGQAVRPIGTLVFDIIGELGEVVQTMKQL